MSAHLNCPNCQVELKRLDLKGITLDHCETCDGLWFDKGELQGVMRIFGGESGTKIVRLLEDIFGTRREGKED